MERSVGQSDHSYAHGRLYAWFDQHGNSQFEPFLIQDIQVGPDRLRTADLVVVKTPRPRESIFTSAPYLCIEVASPDDKFMEMQDRAEDYLAMGVANVWIICPWNRRGWSVTATGWHTAPNLTLTTSDGLFELPVEQVLLPPGE